jgi:hypothetical protein
VGFLDHNMIVINIRDELFKNSCCHHHIPSFTCWVCRWVERGA